MRDYYEEFIESLLKKGVFRKVEKVIYKGHIPSLNDIYGTKHWTARHTAATAFHTIFKGLLVRFLDKPKKLKYKFSLFLFFNSRHDTDNVVGIEKYFTDMLVRDGYVSKDSKDCFRGLTIVPDEQLEKNTVEFLFATHNEKC